MKDVNLYEKVPALENNFSIKFIDLHETPRLIPHWHEHIELLYFFGGECIFTLNGKTFPVREGDLVAINSTEIHSFVSQEVPQYFCILIYPQFFSDISPDSIIPLESLVRGDEYVAKLVTQIKEEFSRASKGSDMLLKGSVYHLMAYLVRNYTAERPTQRELGNRSALLERTSIVLKYISENYSEKITTAQLASLCFLSESHFCRFFKKAIGKSAIDYINEYRVEKASVLLTQTDESISSIAALTGFEDSNYFSRVFRKYKNTTPESFRANKNAS